MKAQVQKWGNSLAVRIPKSFADEIGVAADSVIDLMIHDGQLVIVPVQMGSYELDELLSQITADNLHAEVDTGDLTGGEVW